MKNEEMKTAATQEEFEQLLKEGKPFHLKAAHSITIAKLPGDQPPFVQVHGDSEEITSMLFFAMSEIAEDMKKHGYPKEAIKAIFHSGVEMAVELTDLPDDEPAAGGAMNNIHGEGMFHPDEEKFFEAVEKALGFKLFVWQKTFIATGTFRRFGKTTAEALRELSNVSAPPIDYTLPPRNAREKFHRQTVIEIKEKLEQNGIETRKILRTKREKDAWLKEARAKHADGFRASAFINDETIKRGFKPWL